jgi:hypothetical protein
MRPKLSILTDRGHRAMRQAAHASAPGRRMGAASRQNGVQVSEEAQGRAAEAGAPSPLAAVEAPVDSDAQRVRESGGPHDQAQYNCCCGYVFCAPVSTSVVCPHCGDQQVW